MPLWHDTGMTKTGVGRAVRAVALGVALFGTISRLVLSFRGEMGVFILGYFTVQSNLMVCVFLVVGVARGIGGGLREEAARSAAGTSGYHAVHGAVLLYIAITGLVYNLLLAGGVDDSGFSGVILEINHTITPLLFLIDWLLNQERRAYRARLIGLWLLYPIAYAAFGSIEGARTGEFRYFFLDFASKSTGRYVLELSLVTALFVVVAFAIVGANRLVVRRVAGRRSVPAGP